MRKVKLICFLLAAIYVFGCFVLPDRTATITAAANTDAVTVPLKDLLYDVYDEGNRKIVIITGYLGTDKKIIVPEKINGHTVTSLTQSSFGDSKTLEYIELPASVEYIEPGVFDSSRTLKEITISANNKYYTCVDGVLYNKDMTTLLAVPAAKTGSFTVPKSVVTIADQAFYYCYLLTGVKMYNNVHSIGSYAFAMCWSLKSIRLSDNLQNLGYRAFYGCKSLAEIHLPYSLKTIGKDAFIGGIDSNDNVFYYTTKGIYFVKDSPAQDYVMSLNLPAKYLYTEARTVTDIATNTVLYDSAGVFPKSGKIDLSVKLLPNSNYSALLPCRYSKMLSYKIAFLKNGQEYSLPEACVIRFNGLSGAIPTATKIYLLRDNKLVEKTRAPQAAFIGTSFAYPDTFVVITNNDFSLKGDIDGDGTRSVYDARFALCLAAGLVKKNVTSAQLASANVDGTEGIQTSDAREILRYAAGIK